MINKTDEQMLDEAIERMPITEDQKRIIKDVLKWTVRMGDKYGEKVFSNDGEELDWGQALCREIYGKDWSSYMSENSISVPEQKDLDLALSWESCGIHPEWLDHCE